MEPEPERTSGVLLVGVWVALGSFAPSFVGWCVALGLAMGLVRGSRATWTTWPGSARLAVGGLLLAVGLGGLVPSFEGLLRREGIEGLGARMVARRALTEPAVFPPRLVPGARLHVTATDAVSLVMGERRVEAASLGHGLFAIDVPFVVGREAELVVDGDARTLEAEAPRPGALCQAGERVIVTTSPPSRTSLELAAGRWAAVEHAGAVRGCAFDAEGRVVWVRGDGTLAREGLPIEGAADALVRRGSELVGSKGRELFVVGGETIAMLDWTPTWLVGSEDAVFAARGTRIARIARSAQVARVAQVAQDARIAQVAGEVTTRELPGAVIAMAASETRLVIATNAVEPRDHQRIGNHYVEDAIVELDPRTLVTLAVHRTAHRTRRQDRPGAVDAGLLPRALAFDGDALVVAFAGSGELGRLEDGAWRWTRLPRPLATPTGLAVLRSGGRVLVAPSEGNVALFAEGAWQVRSVAAPSAGARAFFAPTRSGLACASCHVEGSDVLHRLGPAHGSEHRSERKAARPVRSVANVGWTPPYFRDGAYPTLDALVEESVALFGGWRPDVGGDAEALVGWLETRVEGAQRLELGAAREGVDAFVRAGCEGCHAFPAFTDLRVHVELGRDTPSLLGARERFGSDGSYESVDAFLRSGGVHEVADDAMRARIVRFVESLGGPRGW